MAATAPDACQGASFPLTLYAVGELVAGRTSHPGHTIPFTGAANLVLVLAALLLIVVGLTATVGSRRLRFPRRRP
jgi:hypothetical protein